MLLSSTMDICLSGEPVPFSLRRSWMRMWTVAAFLASLGIVCGCVLLICGFALWWIPVLGCLAISLIPAAVGMRLQQRWTHGYICRKKMLCCSAQASDHNRSKQICSFREPGEKALHVRELFFAVTLDPDGTQIGHATLSGPPPQPGHTVYLYFDFSDPQRIVAWEEYNKEEKNA